MRLPWRHRARPSATLHEISKSTRKRVDLLEMVPVTRACVKTDRAVGEDPRRNPTGVTLAGHFQKKQRFSMLKSEIAVSTT